MLYKDPVYKIIFATKICRLEDGNIIHFCLSGHTNDLEGRDRHDFKGKYYTSTEWEDEISEWRRVIPPKDKDIKLQLMTRGLVKGYQYGEHLQRMTRKAESFETIQKEYRMYATVHEGITFYPENGEPVSYPYGSKEKDDIISSVDQGKLKGYYKINKYRLFEKEDIIDALKAGKTMTFFIDRKHKSPKYNAEKTVITEATDDDLIRELRIRGYDVIH